MKKIISLCTLILICLSCKQGEIGLISENAMVVSARKEASQIGSDIMKQGGNAFDAMLATNLALAVAYPYAGNLGGGGFLIYRLNNGDIGGLDYREKAPQAATKDMYLDSLGNVIPNLSTRGALAVGVPGTVAGTFEAHKRFGKLPIKTIMQPIIALAKKGVVVTKKQELRIAEKHEDFKKANKDSILFSRAWKAGDTIKYKKLAETLARIMNNGPEEFYTGESARLLTRFMNDNGGVMTQDDLLKYKPKWRTPITFQYDDLKIISMAPPSSGGICLAQIMRMIEPYDLDKLGHNSVQAIQLLTEAERRSYADRSHFLGDPDFVSIPGDHLISDAYLEDRMANFTFEKATNSKDISYGKVAIIESDETTHFSIVDSFGNAVSVTTTLNSGFGSKLFCNELGFFLNNEMDDFSSKPGVPNLYGLIGSKANSILPEKRMLSSMTPTIVEKNGSLYMVVGTPGGSTIITSVVQTILNVHEYKMNMQEAVNMPRFHHQWLPDEIRMEPNAFSTNVKNELVSKGYFINKNRSPVIGKVDAIMVLEDGRLEGGADKRGDDTAIGF